MAAITNKSELRFRWFSKSRPWKLEYEHRKYESARGCSAGLLPALALVEAPEHGPHAGVHLG